MAMQQSSIIKFCYDTLHDFQVFAEKYAEDQEAFFKDYAEAHAKLSNLGAKFDPPEVCYPLMIVSVAFPRMLTKYN